MVGCHSEDAFFALFLCSFRLLPINGLVRHFFVAIGLIFYAIDSNDPVLGSVRFLEMFQLFLHFSLILTVLSTNLEVLVSNLDPANTIVASVLMMCSHFAKSVLFCIKNQ